MDRFPEIAALMLAGEAVPPVVTVDGVVVTDAAGAVWSDVG